MSYYIILLTPLAVLLPAAGAVDPKPETIVVGALDSYEARCRDCHEPGQDVAKSLAA